MAQNRIIENSKGENRIPKWVYALIIALVLGFCVYGYFKVSTWVRYFAIERYEKPISNYTITKVYSETNKSKKKGRGVNNDDEDESAPTYYMEVWYKDKDYQLEIEEHTYSKYNKSGDITLYYDAKADNIFVAGTGGANLLVTALATIVVLLSFFIYLIIRLIKLFKRKR